MDDTGFGTCRGAGTTGRRDRGGGGAGAGVRQRRWEHPTTATVNTAEGVGGIFVEHSRDSP